MGENRLVAEKTFFAGIKPKRQAPHAPPRLVAVLAFDGVVLGDLSTPCELFGRVGNADGSAAYEVRVCSLGPEIESEHVTLKVRWRLSSLNRAQTVIVPGIDDLDRALPEELVRAVRRAIDRGARVASICTGAFILARAGALDSLRATTHWRSASELARRYPAIDVNPDVLYVDNGQVLTSAGAAAGLDLCLHLVRLDLGAEAAADVARAAVMPLERAGGQAQFIVHQPPSIGDASLGPLLTWIEQNLRRELSLAVIARRAAMSTRTLSRRFREQVGATPAHWIGAARVRRAQRLLETTDLSVEEVASEAGFGSATVLRERFGGLVGTSPIAYRRTFRRSKKQGDGVPPERAARRPAYRD
jgi:transcriptional regulator GlxA family with amidase domain